MRAKWEDYERFVCISKYFLNVSLRYRRLSHTTETCRGGTDCEVV
jgi:hypothetical protein